MSLQICGVWLGLDWIQSSGGGSGVGRGMRDPGGDRAGADPAPPPRCLVGRLFVRIRFDLFCFLLFIIRGVLEFLP